MGRQRTHLIWGDTMWLASGTGLLLTFVKISLYKIHMYLEAYVFLWFNTRHYLRGSIKPNGWKKKVGWLWASTTVISEDREEQEGQCFYFFYYNLFSVDHQWVYELFFFIFPPRPPPPCSLYTHNVQLPVYIRHCQESLSFRCPNSFHYTFVAVAKFT